MGPRAASVASLEANCDLKAGFDGLTAARAEIAGAADVVASAAEELMAGNVTGDRSDDLGAKLLEAAAFADVCGQRLQQVQGLLERIAAAWPGGPSELAKADLLSDRSRRETLLIFGPAISGCEMSQVDADRLFGG